MPHKHFIQCVHLCELLDVRGCQKLCHINHTESSAGGDVEFKCGLSIGKDMQKHMGINDIDSVKYYGAHVSEIIKINNRGSVFCLYFGRFSITIKWPEKLYYPNGKTEK